MVYWWSEGSASSRSGASSWCIAWCQPPLVSNTTIEPRNAADEQLYAEGLDQVQRLADARRMRLVAAEEGVPGVLWAVLIFGGTAAVSFTYLFGLESTWAHRLMVIILAAVIGLVLERFETSDLSDIK